MNPSALIITNRIKQVQEKLALAERKQRLEQRREHEVQKKQQERRCFIAGKFLLQYFPEYEQLKPGTDAENAVEFEPLETFLSTLSKSEKIREIIKNQLRQKRPAQTGIVAIAQKSGTVISR